MPSLLQPETGNPLRELILSRASLVKSLPEAAHARPGYADWLYPLPVKASQFESRIFACIHEALSTVSTAMINGYWSDAELQEIVSKLVADQPLTPRHRPHVLKGEYNGFWECHIRPDWLLIWYRDEEALELRFARTGTHSDLFD